jgi:SAM-dependent methyltransferase
MSRAKEGLKQLDVTVESVNAAHRLSALTLRRRARQGVRPIEAALMTRYRVELSGHVLELGSRGDGLTGLLQHHASSLTGVAGSAREAELCRVAYPDTRFLARSLTEVDAFADGQFDAIVAGRCALDRLGDDPRRQLLGCLSRILTDDGVLIFSSHNLACESLVRTPLRHALARPWGIASLPRAVRNRALLGRLQQRSHGYAMLNDASEGYSRLSYYVSRDAQERQLIEGDLTLQECVDSNDDPVPAGGHAYRERELYYVTRPGAELGSRSLLG